MITPDDIIILDYFIYTKGNEIHRDLWDKVKDELKRLAHAKS